MSKRTSQAESLLACILDNASVSMLCVDRDLRVILAGRGWRTHLRGDKEADELRQVFANSTQVDELEELVRNAFLTRKPVVGRRLEDHNRHYEYGVAPFVWHKKVVYAIIVLRDITEELRLGEEVRAVQRYVASIVESASDIVISLDLSGQIVTWNNAAHRITGLSTQDVKGRKLSELCPGGSGGAMSRAIAETLKTKRIGTVRLPFCGRGGEERTVDWAFSAMLDETGGVDGVVAVGRDLTERLEAEAHLQQADRLAALGVMAGGIAHEVRNPLAVSAAAAQLLLKRRLDKATQAECAKKIHSGIERASSIIENLLRFARPSEPGRQSVFDIGHVIRDALKLLENQRKLARIKLHLSLNRLGATIRGNRTLLQQAFMNLLLNAIDAMPDGGRLSISSSRKDDSVVVRLKDTGSGIGPKEINKVFDPFFTTRPAGKGSGLGLSITHSIIDQHSGHIEIESAEGRGSTVTVALPCAKEGS